MGRVANDVNTFTREHQANAIGAKPPDHTATHAAQRADECCRG
jgi:hypothetical protein